MSIRIISFSFFQWCFRIFSGCVFASAVLLVQGEQAVLNDRCWNPVNRKDGSADAAGLPDVWKITGDSSLIERVRTAETFCFDLIGAVGADGIGRTARTGIGQVFPNRAVLRRH